MGNPENSGILYACALDGSGGGALLPTEDSIDAATKDGRAVWVHLDATLPESRTWLEKEAGYLDPIITDALLAGETRPRVLEFEKGTLLILRGVNLNEDAEPEDMISIRLWIEEKRIISTRRRRLKAVQDIRALITDGKGPKNSGDFLVMLSARMFERMEPILTDLDERTDAVEEEILDRPDIGEREEIIDIRKMAITLRRYIAPQRDVMIHLRTTDMPWLDATHKRRLQESLDRVTRYTEDLDMIRERAQVIKDELANALSDRLNKNMYVLSVIAAVFLPLSFLTGLLGINIGGIPGADDPNAFMIFCAFLATIVTLQIILFKTLKWF